MFSFNLSPILFLRVAMALLVLYFGIMQIIAPGQWTFYIPEMIINLSEGIISLQTIVLLNGLTEIVLGAFLFFGIFTKVVAYLLALHIFLIALTIGFNPTGVRDLGLAAALAYIGMSTKK